MRSFETLAADLLKSGEEIAARMTEAEADLWHCAPGVSGEAGELLDAIKKRVVYKREIDRANVVEEIGDIRFYIAGLMKRLAITDAEVISALNAKLSVRYPDGYTDAAANIRADKVEDVKIVVDADSVEFGSFEVEIDEYKVGDPVLIVDKDDEYFAKTGVIVGVIKNEDCTLINVDIAGPFGISQFTEDQLERIK